MEDKISALPDDILILIISLIPTNEALATNTLSKRWRTVSRFLPALDFACPSARNSKAFTQGVCGVLRRRRVSIRSFRLFCFVTESQTLNTIERCLNNIRESSIEKLYLHTGRDLLFSDLCFSASRFLSQMPSLKHFTLKCCIFQPDLKNLHHSLTSIKLFSVKVRGPLDCILTYCLSLSSLTIKYCALPPELRVRGPNLRLECLSIQNCYRLVKLDLYAPNLLMLELFSWEMESVVLDHAPRLQTVSLFFIDFEKVMPYICKRLREDMPHLKTLLVDNIEECFQVDRIDMGSTMLKFDTLKLLDLSLEFGKSSFNLFWLTPVLHNCTVLEEFHFTAVDVFYYWEDEGKDVFIHPYLKDVELHGFGGTKKELNFLSYILKSAVKLQVMTISYYSRWYNGTGKWEGAESPPLCGFAFKEVDESIQQLKHEAVSKSAQVIFQKVSHMGPKKPQDAKYG